MSVKEFVNPAIQEALDTGDTGILVKTVQRELGLPLVQAKETAIKMVLELGYGVEDKNTIFGFRWNHTPPAPVPSFSCELKIKAEWTMNCWHVTSNIPGMLDIPSLTDNDLIRAIGPTMAQHLIRERSRNETVKGNAIS